MAELTMSDLATKGQGTATTTLSAITTGLLALGNGGLSNILGGGNASASSEKICELREQVAILTSEKSMDAKLVEVYKTLAAYDKQQDAKVAALDSRVLALETSAPLKEQIVDQKIARVADTMNCCCNAANASITALQKTLGSITQTIVPKSAILPEYMDRYNSWSAPANNAAGGNG